jgi:hypothetical protein
VEGGGGFIVSVLGQYFGGLALFYELRDIIAECNANLSFGYRLFDLEPTQLFTHASQLIPSTTSTSYV